MRAAVNEQDPRARRSLESRPLMKAFYNAAPWYLQNLMVSSYGLLLQRYATGQKVQGHLSQLMESQWLSKDELVGIQSHKLRSLIDHAYHNVPYYRELFDSLHLKPEDIREPTDLLKFPLLSKQDLMEHRDRLVALNFDRRRLNYYGSGGTTGTPLYLYVTDENEATERALNLRMRRWAGWHPGQRRATFNGSKPVPVDRRGTPLWRHDWPERRLFFSIWHMTRENIGLYLERLRAFHPKIVEGYAGYLHLLALHMERAGQTLPVHAIFSYSEPLYPDQRRLIEERFQCKVFDWYGLSERVASAAQCERTDGYHVSAEKTIVEIINSDGEQAAPGEQGEIVGTNLDEYGMPLIRYRTGDMSSYRAEPCPCGRGLPLIEQVQGRLQDFITTPDGRLIRFWGAGHAGLRHASVEKSQLIQETRDRIVIKVVPSESYSQTDHDRIMTGFGAVLGPKVNISIELVDDIPRTASGKHRIVISKVAVEV